MKLGSSNFFMVTFMVVALLTVKTVSGQQHIKVQNDKGEGIEDAVLTYSPLKLKSFQKIAITNTSGKAIVESETPFILVISKIGYITVADTLNPGENKTYSLATSNINLKDVVITGQFEAVTADKSVQKVRVIDRQRIEQQGAVNLRDLLTNELNIRLDQDAVLGSQLNIMGISGANVKILIDGVPVIGRNDGNIDISQINLNNIERVEIIEGPMSVIYGTDAIAGTINLITKKPGNKLYTANINTQYETVGTYNADINAGVQYKNTQLSVSGGRNYFDGYSPNEDPKQRVMLWKPKEQYFADAQLRFRFGKQNHRVYSQYFTEKITARYAPEITPYSVTGFNDYFVTIRLNNALYSDYYFNNKATLNLINSYSTYERRKLAYVKNLVSGSETYISSPSAQDTTKIDLVLLRGTYTTNASSIFNSQLGYDINLESGDGEKMEKGHQFIGDYALFYMSDIKATSRLNLRQGFRFIYNTRFGAPVIPSINIKYDLSSSLVARASYTQGFRSPSLKELSLFFVDVNHNIRGNSDLKAERSDNYLASLTYSKNYTKINYKVEGSVFYNHLRDMIDLAIADSTQQLYTYINHATFKTQGINLNAEFSYNRKIRIGGGYSYTGRYNGLKPDFLYASEFRMNGTYSFIGIKTDVSVFYKYTGSLPRYIEQNGTVIQSTTEDYQMLDASVTKSFKNNIVVLIAGVKNITNLTNINSASSGGAHSGGSASVPAAMGRYFFTSIRINIAKN